MRLDKYICPNCLKSFKSTYGSSNQICGSCGEKTIPLHYSIRVPKVNANKRVWKKFIKHFFSYCAKNPDCRYQEKAISLFEKFNLPIT